MELEKIDINGLNDIYALNVVQKEFRKAVDEPWKENPPWQRYQKKLMQDLAVLDMEKERGDYKKAINAAKKRLKWLES